MQGSGSPTDSTYDYEYSHAGETIRLGIQCSSGAREPRVCWQVGERSGERGHVRLSGSEPIIHLEEGEKARLDGQLITNLPVTREIGEELKIAIEKLGTVVTESSRITADPATFPAEIGSFERVGWEDNRNVMWYWRDELSAPRAYQIERGELVFRAQEWAEDSCSKDDLIDRYDLKMK